MNIILERKFLNLLNNDIGIVHRICRSYAFDDRSAREDLFQEIMYQLWKSYPLFKGQSKFSTWMYKVALNTAIVYLRKKNKAPDREKLMEKHEQMPEPAGSGSDAERHHQLISAIATLSDIDKAIVLLYLDEHSYDEIASLMGMTKSNVSIRLVRIKKILEQKLNKNINP